MVARPCIALAGAQQRIFNFRPSGFLLLFNGADEIFDVHFVGRRLSCPAELPSPQRKLEGKWAVAIVSL